MCLPRVAFREFEAQAMSPDLGQEDQDQTLSITLTTLESGSHGLLSCRPEVAAPNLDLLAWYVMHDSALTERNDLNCWQALL